MISNYNLNQQHKDAGFIFPEEIVEAMKFLWYDVGLKEGFDLLRRDYYILDSAS